MALATTWKNKSRSRRGSDAEIASLKLQQMVSKYAVVDYLTGKLIDTNDTAAMLDDKEELPRENEELTQKTEKLVQSNA